MITCNNATIRIVVARRVVATPARLISISILQFSETSRQFSETSLKLPSQGWILQNWNKVLPTGGFPLIYLSTKSSPEGLSKWPVSSLSSLDPVYIWHVKQRGRRTQIAECSLFVVPKNTNIFHHQNSNISPLKSKYFPPSKAKNWFPSFRSNQHLL